MVCIVSVRSSSKNGLTTIAVCGPRNEIAARVRARCGDFADRVSLVAPYAPDPAAWADIARALRTTA